MLSFLIEDTVNMSHAPHGACELKLRPILPFNRPVGHAPHGACELKLVLPPTFDAKLYVTLPTERVS